MSLQVWLPLTKDLHNQGLANVTITNNGATYSSTGGKLGGCYKTSSTATVDLGYNGNQVNSGSLSFGGWFKFNKDEIWSAISGKTYTSSASSATGNLIGNNSYGGVSLQWWSNNIYTGGSLSYIAVQSYLRTSTNGARSTGTTVIPFDTWTHIFLTYDKTNNMLQYWVNGELKSSNAQVAFTDAVSRNLTINYGGIAGGNGPGANIPFYVNDVRIYDHCLSAMEVKELSNGLVLHYPLNRGGWGQENLIADSNVEQTSVNSYKYWLFTTAGVTAATGNTCTISFDAKSTVDNVACDVYFRSSSGMVGSSTIVTGITTDYRRYSITMTAPTATFVSICCRNNGNVSGANTSATYSYKNIKVELGSVATPWCPNSSDALATTMGLNGTTEYDCSGYNYNGLKNNITYTSDTPKYSVSSTFNGTDSYIKIDTNTWMPQGMDSMTINLWAKSSSWAGAHLFSCTESGGFNTESGNSGYLRFPIHVYTNAEQTSTAYKYDSTEIQISALSTTDWNMLTFVYDSTGTKTYINGELHHTYTYTSYGIHFNTNARLFLGCEASTASPTSPYFSGQESDFRIYATALSAEQIADLFHTSATVDANGNIYAREVAEVL